MLQRACLLLVCTLIVTSCASQSSGRYGSDYQPGGGGSQSRGNGQQRAALLLPLTGPRADLGLVLRQAALLALPSGSRVTLDVLDTAGTPDGAIAAAKTAVGNGDSLILGPLTSGETAAVVPIARTTGSVILAFTNNAAQSQPGVWTIGVTPDQQIRRLVTAAQSQDKTQFAALLPDTDFGRAMASALQKVAATSALPPPALRMHGSDMASITASVRALSGYANRRGPIDAKIKAARALGSAEGRRQAQELVKTPIPPPDFNVLLLGDTGDELQEVAAILPYYDVDRSAVQIIGPALWSSSASSAGTVSGAWYAAPDGSARANFARIYQDKYGVAPPPIADLAFDAASIAGVVLQPQGVDMGALTQPSGFVGTDGWVAFSADGQVRRGLAVFRVERGGATMIEPAPTSSGTPGS